MYNIEGEIAELIIVYYRITINGDSLNSIEIKTKSTPRGAFCFGADEGT